MALKSFKQFINEQQLDELAFLAPLVAPLAAIGARLGAATAIRAGAGVAARTAAGAATRTAAGTTTNIAPRLAGVSSSRAVSGVVQGKTSTTMGKKVLNSMLKTSAISAVSGNQNQQPEQQPEQKIEEPIDVLNPLMQAPDQIRTFSAKNQTGSPQQQSGGSIKSSAVGTLGAAQQAYMRNLYSGMQGR